ncbi:hypothetical protein DAMA08_043140 [Martiniozyma asiatica (nom. inval.)]|nr:hypothetical protein DAMA08_043140 [Martiniozyma asiatica]
MAHSARSKSKLKAKAIKTQTPGTDYHNTAEARRERIAKKLKENLEKQIQEKEIAQTDTMTDDSVPTTSNIEEKVIDYQNVSTHGWRKSRKASYKKKHSNKKKNKSIKF